MTPLNYTAVFYQADSHQIFWIGGAQGFPVFGGTFEQQVSPVTPFRAASASAAEQTLRRKH